MDYSFYSNPQSQQPFSVYDLHGLPTPDQNNPAPNGDDINDPFSSLNYHSFHPSFRIQNPAAPSSFVPPPHSPPESFSKHSVSSNDFPNSHAEPGSVEGGDDQLQHRSSSEEKDNLTPAQSKRKAQNRAAATDISPIDAFSQRAFRERKERHVRELEEKVSALEQESTTLAADNERLKRELAKFATENEVLRATTGQLASSQGRHLDSEPTITGPMKYTPTDFYTNLVPKGEPAPTHRVTVCEKTGERLLDAGATWDLIQGHELYKQGLVDIGDVSNRLKGMAQCNGQGPAFREGQVLQAIEASAAACRDELI
ncbi:AP-1-like transcription factor [Aspergillus fumigatus]